MKYLHKLGKTRHAIALRIQEIRNIHAERQVLTEAELLSLRTAELRYPKLTRESHWEELSTLHHAITRLEDEALHRAVNDGDTYAAIGRRIGLSGVMVAQRLRRMRQRIYHTLPDIATDAAVKATVIQYATSIAEL